MDKSHPQTGKPGGPLDIGEDAVYRNETDREIKAPESDAGIDPDDRPNLAAVKAGLRYGRDSYIVASDVDPDEDNYAPGIREQD